MDFNKVSGKHTKAKASEAFKKGFAVFVNVPQIVEGETVLRPARRVLIEPGDGETFHTAMLARGLKLLGKDNSRFNSVWYQILTVEEYTAAKTHAKQKRKGKDMAAALLIARQYVDPISTVVEQEESA
jgi:hypothetical protein